MAGHRPRRRCGRVLAVARGAERPGGVPRRAGRRDGEPEPVYAEVRRSARSSTRLRRRSPEPPRMRGWRCSTATRAAGRSTFSATPPSLIRSTSWWPATPRSRSRQAVDVSPPTPRSTYQLVVAPALNVITEARPSTDGLCEGRRPSGAGAALGMKDSYNG